MDLRCLFCRLVFNALAHHVFHDMEASSEQYLQVARTLRPSPQLIVDDSPCSANTRQASMSTMFDRFLSIAPRYDCYDLSALLQMSRVHKFK